MTRVERVLAQHQKYKEITRLGGRKGLRRLVAGTLARLTGLRLYALYKLRRPQQPAPLTGEGSCIVSLTSFPPRMGTLWMTVDTLLRQSVRPAAIRLYLSVEDFPERSLPASLMPYLSLGLEVAWVEDNLRPHKKYWYAFQEETAGRRRCVIMVDDDVFYPSDLVERLLRLHEAHPEAVCANRAVRVRGDRFSDNAPVLHPEGPASDLVGIGSGGILYPPAFYANYRQVLDTKTIKAVCPKTDDLWLKHCELLSGTGVVTGPFMAIPAEIPSSQTVRLARDNVSRGVNDEVWARLGGMACPCREESLT